MSYEERLEWIVDSTNSQREVEQAIEYGRSADQELATLRAENERLREAMESTAAQMRFYGKWLRKQRGGLAGDPFFVYAKDLYAALSEGDQ